MKRNIFKTLFLVLAVMCSLPALAQNKTVTGTIVDETGEPVIGATVRVEGTQIAAVTDFDGNYSIEVPKDGKVVVSYIGYKDMPTTGGRLQLQTDSNDLEEVVVVGYGVQKKAHLTGSIATVPMDEIQDLSSGSLGSTLSGLVNGLNVDGGSSDPTDRAHLYVRDSKSIGEITGKKQEPLFVIDGFIYPNDVRVGNQDGHNLGAEAFNNLDPSEVESITVLKDAAAAVYGARAADGVILVTTKKGKLGEPRISYSGQFGVTDAVSLPKMLNGYEHARLYNAWKAADPRNTSLNVLSDLYQYDELESMRNYNYDLLDKYWKSAFTQKHSVNVSGATDKVSYFANVGYFKQDGNLGKLDSDRWNYRAGIDVKISKWLKANLSVSGDYGKTNKPNANVGMDSGNYGYKDLLLRPQSFPEEVNGYPIGAYGITGGETKSYQKYSFDVLQNNGDYIKDMTSNTTINGSIEYDFGWNKYLKGLSLKFSYAKSISTDKTNEYGSEYTVYNMRDRFGSGSHVWIPTGVETDLDALYAESNFLPVTAYNGADHGYLSRKMIRSDNYQMNFTVNYNRDFGLHHVGALFSIEKSEAESEYSYLKLFGPYSFTNGQSNTVDNSTTPDYEINRSESGTLSYIGRLNYSYASKYLFEFLLRSDASTKFAPKNYWGTFPSFSAGWVMSEESWFREKIHWIDYLKVRGSFGITGRDNTLAWQWTERYAVDKGKGAVFGTNGAEVNTGITMNKNIPAVNTDIHWDKSYKVNAGIDARFLKQRLAVTFDAYKVWNREMLMDVKNRQDIGAPATVGTQSAYQNFGKMDSWGYELSLNWNDRIGNDFKYRIGLNTGYSDNKVLDADFATDAKQQYMLLYPGHRADMGTWGLQCIGMFRSFQEIEEYFYDNLRLKDENGNYIVNADGSYVYGTYLKKTLNEMRPGMLIYKDVRGAQQADGSYAGPDGIVDEYQDLVELSHRSNPYGFTLNLGADWKGLSLTAQLSASWGGYSFIPGQALKPGDGLEFTNMPSFWNADNMFSYVEITDPNDPTKVLVSKNLDGNLPSLYYSDINSRTSSFWRVSGTTVTLNRLTLAYTLPSNWVKPIGIQSVRLNVTGQNLINFYNPYPDNFISPMNSAYGSYPKLRKWTIGVNVSF